MPRPRRPAVVVSLIAFFGAATATAQPSAAFPTDEPPTQAPARPAPTQPAPPQPAPPRPVPARPAPPPPAPSVRTTPPAPPTAPATPATPSLLPSQPLSPTPPSAATWSAPPALPVYGKLPPPPGYTLKTRANTGLLVGGAITFLASYAGAVGYGLSQGFEEGTKWLVVPIAGPWGAIGQRDLDCDVTVTSQTRGQEEVDLCQEQTIREVRVISVMAVMGLGQVLGATLFTIGMVDRRELWVRDDLVGWNWTLDWTASPGGTTGALRAQF